MSSLSLFSLLFSLCLSTPMAPQLKLDFGEVEKRKGSIRFAVFNNAQDFKDGKEGMLELSFSLEEVDNLIYLLKDLPAGQYGIAAYHDLNDNGELDTGLFGIPSEPYGFSNNPKAKWRAPKYEEIAFEFNADSEQELQLMLKRWRKR